MGFNCSEYRDVFRDSRGPIPCTTRELLEKVEGGGDVWSFMECHVSRAQLLEWCRDNSVVRENPVRENTTHYTVEYTCKTVLVLSYHALGCEKLIFQGVSPWYLYVKDCLSLYVCNCYKEHETSKRNV